MTSLDQSSATDPLDGVAETLNRAAVAALARGTFGLSPHTLVQAYADWAMHLAGAPGKQLQLAAKLMRKYARLGDYTRRYIQDSEAEPTITPLP